MLSVKVPTESYGEFGIGPDPEGLFLNRPANQDAQLCHSQALRTKGGHQKDYPV